MTEQNKQTDIQISVIKKESITDIVNIKNQEDLNNIMATIAKGNPILFPTAASAITKFVKSKELGIGFITGAEHMHEIQGKTGIDIHIVRAILLSSKDIYWTKVKDYTQVPKYATVDKQYFDYVPEGHKVIKAKEPNAMKLEKDNAIAEGLIPLVLTGYDYVTEYKFSRIKRLSDGSTITLEATGKFSWNDALQAGLPLDKNGAFNELSAWFKYRQLMVDTRAFTFGSRAIADDLLLGMREYTELLDIEGKNYDVDKEGNVIDITNNNK